MIERQSFRVILDHDIRHANAQGTALGPVSASGSVSARASSDIASLETAYTEGEVPFCVLALDNSEPIGGTYPYSQGGLYHIPVGCHVELQGWYGGAWHTMFTGHTTMESDEAGVMRVMCAGHEYPLVRRRVQCWHTAPGPRGELGAIWHALRPASGATTTTPHQLSWYLHEIRDIAGSLTLRRPDVRSVVGPQYAGIGARAAGSGPGLRFNAGETLWSELQQKVAELADYHLYCRLTLTLAGISGGSTAGHTQGDPTLLGSAGPPPAFKDVVAGDIVRITSGPESGSRYRVVVKVSDTELTMGADFLATASPVSWEVLRPRPMMMYHPRRAVLEDADGTHHSGTMPLTSASGAAGALEIANLVASDGTDRLTPATMWAEAAALIPDYADDYTFGHDAAGASNVVTPDLRYEPGAEYDLVTVLGEDAEYVFASHPPGVVREQAGNHYELQETWVPNIEIAELLAETIYERSQLAEWQGTLALDGLYPYLRVGQVIRVSMPGRYGGPVYVLIRSVDHEGSADSGVFTRLIAGAVEPMTQRRQRRAEVWLSDVQRWLGMGDEDHRCREAVDDTLDLSDELGIIRGNITLDADHIPATSETRVWIGPGAGTTPAIEEDIGTLHVRTRVRWNDHASMPSYPTAPDDGEDGVESTDPDVAEWVIDDARLDPARWYRMRYWVVIEDAGGGTEQVYSLLRQRTWGTPPP